MRRWGSGAGCIKTADDVVKTRRAALGIRAEFESARARPVPAGRGSTPAWDRHRPAVAGKIGTVDQVKVGSSARSQPGLAARGMTRC